MKDDADKLADDVYNKDDQKADSKSGANKKIGPEQNKS